MGKKYFFMVMPIFIETWILIIIETWILKIAKDFGDRLIFTCFLSSVCAVAFIYFDPEWYFELDCRLP